MLRGVMNLKEAQLIENYLLKRNYSSKTDKINSF